MRFCNPESAFECRSKARSSTCSPRCSRCALEMAYIAFSRGGDFCARGKTIWRNGFPDSSLKTMRWLNTLQKWSRRPLLDSRVVYSENGGTLKSYGEPPEPLGERKALVGSGYELLLDRAEVGANISLVVAISSSYGSLAKPSRGSIWSCLTSCNSGAERAKLSRESNGGSGEFMSVNVSLPQLEAESLKTE